MKRTLTINLNGIIFNIDEDAYQMLDNYLTEIKRHFSADEEKEILEDIEARIAEILLEKNRTKEAVVTIERITEIIETLGYANQFDEQEAEPSNSNNENKKKRYRKFYRDADNQILGGVAAGLAAYLQMNVKLVRIIFFILAIIGFGWTILAYIICWVVRPAAKSTAQKLEMKGEEPTIDNIRNYLNSEEFNSSAANVASGIGKVLILLFKIMAVTVGLLMAAFGVIIIFAIITAGIALIVGTAQSTSPIAGTTLLIAFAITFTLSIIIPTISIIINTIRLLRNDTKPRNKIAGWSWFAVWILSILSSIIVFIFICKEYEPLNNRFQNLYFRNYSTIEVDDSINMTKEYYRGKEFNAIEVDGAAQVLLVSDSVNYVEMYGSELAQKLTTIDIRNETLYISKWNNTHNTKFVVHYKELNSIEANTASYIYNRGKLRTDKLRIEANTASKIELDVKCDTIEVSASTASKIELEGAANFASITASTASKIEVDDMKIEEISY